MEISKNQKTITENENSFGQKRIGTPNYDSAELFTSFGDAKVLPSTKIENLKAPDVEELIKRKLSLTAGMNVTFALRPCLTIEPDPQLWYQREELFRVMALQSDSSLSRRREELYPIWAAPSSDLLGRMGYTNAADIVSLYGDDSPTALAAKVMARIEAEAWSLTQDMLWILALMRTFQSMPGTGFGKLMLSRLSLTKMNTMISNLAGLPIPKSLKDSVIKSFTPSIRVVANSTPVNNTIVYRIPMVIYGVMADHGDGTWTNPSYNATGGYDPGYMEDFAINADGKITGGATLCFNPTHPNSNSAINYGWNFSQAIQSVNQNFNYPGAKTGDITSDTIYYASSKSGLLTANQNAMSFRLVESLIMHFRCVAMRLHAIWGFKTNNQGYKANKWLGNLSYDADNSSELYDTLTNAETGLFDTTFDPYLYLTEISEALMNPVDDVELVKQKMTINKDISNPIRMQAILGSGYTGKKPSDADMTSFSRIYPRSSDLIFEGDLSKSRSQRSRIAFNTLQYRVLSFYKSLAFEMTNYIDKYHNYWSNYTNVVNRQNQEWLPNPDSIVFRPDISIACINKIKAKTEWTDDDNELVVAQSLPYWIDDSDPTKDTAEKKRKVYIPFEGFCDPTINDKKTRINSTHKLLDAFLLNATNMNNSNDYKDLKLRKNDFASLVGAFQYSPNNKETDMASNSSPFFVSSRYEWLKMISGLDTAKVYAGMDEAAEFFSMAKSNLFIDINLAMETLSEPTIRAFSKDATVYDSIAFTTVSGDTLSKSVAQDSIRAWTPRTVWNDTSNDVDPFYCIDYKIESSVTEVTPVVTRDPTKYDRPQWSLIPTSFDEPIVDLFNYTTNNNVIKRDFFGGGTLEGSANKMDGLLFVFQMMARCLEVRPTRMNSDLCLLLSAMDDTVVNAFVLTSDVGQTASTLNAAGYHKFMALRVYARWNAQDVESAIYGLPAFDAYTVKVGPPTGKFDSETFQSIRANLINAYSWHAQNGMFTPKRGSLLGVSKTNTAAAAFIQSNDIYAFFEDADMKKGLIRLPEIKRDTSNAIDFVQYPFDSFTKRFARWNKKDGVNEVGNAGGKKVDKNTSDKGKRNSKKRKNSGKRNQVAGSDKSAPSNKSAPPHGDPRQGSTERGDRNGEMSPQEDEISKKDQDTSKGVTK